jgi:hypothetical protein
LHIVRRKPMSESVTREIVLPLERDEAWRVVT